MNLFYSAALTLSVGSAALCSSAPSGVGDMTFYPVGVGSCGKTISDSQSIVALSYEVMNNPPNPNNNPLCGKSITTTYNGIVKTATVEDTCQGCPVTDIDVNEYLFEQFASLSIGRLQNVSWAVDS